MPLAEFAANNGISEATKCTPFFAVQGVDPRMTFQGEPTQEQNQLWLDADKFQATMQQVHEHQRVEIRRSQALQEESANIGCTPAPDFQVGSKGWLDTNNVRTTRPTRKLDCKLLGPFSVCRRVSPYAYELELHASIRIDRVQPVSCFDPVVENPGEEQWIDPPPPPTGSGRGRRGISSIWC